ncbi:MAG: carbohydrate ABC transporter permease [Stackebrandtia sp.]
MTTVADETRDEDEAAPGTEAPRRQRVRKRKRRTAHIHIALTLVCALLCGPVLYAMLASTQTNVQLLNFQPYPGSSFLENLDVVWNQRELGYYMLNSTLMSVIIAAGKTVTALLAGLAFVYFRFPGRWIVFFFVLITLMMPTEISILALFRIVADFGLNGELSLAGLTIPFLATATGAFLFRQHFANLPANLSEAAQLDGANPFQFLVRVLIPVSWNVIGALTVIEFLYGWHMYLWPLLRRDDVVQVGLASLQQAGEGQSYGPLMLGAVIASIPPILVFLLLQKPFMKGFAMTRDK